MGKYVMERLFKVFNIAGMAFIFVGGHTGYISGKDMLYQLLLFVIVYCLWLVHMKLLKHRQRKAWN